MSQLKNTKKVAAISLCLFLVACGGGGGDTESATGQTGTNQGGTSSGTNPGGTGTSTGTAGSNNTGSTGTSGNTGGGTTSTGNTSGTSTGGTGGAGGSSTSGETTPNTETGSDGEATAGSTPAASASIALSARFFQPAGIAVHPDGTVYISEYGNDVIRKFVPSTGHISTVAGKPGVSGSTDGPANEATFTVPRKIVVDQAHNLYVIDEHAIRKISSSGNVSTLAGNVSERGYADGIGAAARFQVPADLTLDAQGNVYVADKGNRSVRKITPNGIVTTVAGKPLQDGTLDDPNDSVPFSAPYGIAMDSQGILFVLDEYRKSVQKILPNGTIEPFISNLEMTMPRDMDMDANNNIYISENFIYSSKPINQPDANSRVHMITSGDQIITLAGTKDVVGSADGTGSAASFYRAIGIAATPSGVLYVADDGNHNIRRITQSGEVTTVAGKAGEPGYKDVP
jgi:hypothetical protein